MSFNLMAGVEGSDELERAAGQGVSRSCGALYVSGQRERLESVADLGVFTEQLPKTHETSHLRVNGVCS